MFLNGIVDQLFFSISHLAQVEAPGSQTEGNERVEDANINDGEPVLNGRHFPAVVFTTIHPGEAEHLTHEHDSAHDEIVAKHQLWVTLDAAGIAYHLE